MAVGDVFLIRRTGGLWTKYSNVSSVGQTGAANAYGSVTGVAATDVIAAAGSTPVNGYEVVFLSLTGGLGIALNTSYKISNASGSTFKLNQGGAAVDFTTDITAANILIIASELRQWSPEYRDIFTPAGVEVEAPPVLSTPGGSVLSMTAATVTDVQVHSGTGSPSSPGYVSGTIGVTNSDEIIHNGLRQTLLNRTFWQFNISTGTPTVLYADILPGDIISNNPPQTV